MPVFTVIAERSGERRKEFVRGKTGSIIIMYYAACHFGFYSTGWSILWCYKREQYLIVLGIAQIATSKH